MTITFDIIKEKIKLHKKFKKSTSHQRSNEFFSNFVVRINDIMIETQINENTKCMHFQFLIQFRFRRKTYVVIDYFNYRKYCSKIIRIWQNMIYHFVDMNNNKIIKQKNNKYKFKRYQSTNFEFAKTFRKKFFFVNKTVWNIFRFKKHSTIKKKLMK